MMLRAATQRLSIPVAQGGRLLSSALRPPQRPLLSRGVRARGVAPISSVLQSQRRLLSDSTNALSHYKRERLLAKIGFGIHNSRRDARRKVDNARDDIRAVANAVIDRLEERDEAVMAPLAFKKWQLQIEGEDLDRKDQATLDQRAKLQQELEVAHDIAYKTKADARSRRASKATSARALFRSRDERKATLRQRATSSAGAPARHYETAYSSARDFEPGERRSRGSVSFSVGHYYQTAPSAFEPPPETR